MSEYVKQLGIFGILGFIGVVGAFALLSPTVQTPVINALSPQWIAGWLLAAGGLYFIVRAYMVMFKEMDANHDPHGVIPMDKRRVLTWAICSGIIFGAMATAVALGVMTNGWGNPPIGIDQRSTAVNVVMGSMFVLAIAAFIVVMFSETKRIIKASEDNAEVGVHRRTELLTEGSRK